MPVIQSPFQGVSGRLTYQEQQQSALTVLLKRGGRRRGRKSFKKQKELQEAERRFLKQEENPRNRSRASEDCGREQKLVQASLRNGAFHRTHEGDIQPKGQM